MARTEVGIRVVAAADSLRDAMEAMHLQVAILRDSMLTEDELLAALGAGRGTEEADR